MLRYDYAAGTFGAVAQVKDAVSNTTLYHLGGKRPVSTALRK
jgi:hypothetical protein